MTIALLIANWAAVLSLAAFVILYLPSPWWRNAYGRSIVSMKAAVLMLSVAGLWRRHAMEPSPTDWALILGYGAIAVVMAWRTRMLWHDLRRDNEPPPESL